MATYNDLSGKELENYLEFLKENYDPVAEARQEKLQWLEFLREEYELHKELRKNTMRAVTRYAKEMREAPTQAEAERWIGYIRTCKLLVQAIDEANIDIRKEMREVARGTKSSRR